LPLGSFSIEKKGMNKIGGLRPLFFICFPSLNKATIKSKKKKKEKSGRTTALSTI
jgi:hypothetical protein